MGQLTGHNRVDRGQPGPKIHALSDRGGISPTVLISAANTHEHLLLDRVVDFGILTGSPKLSELRSDTIYVDHFQLIVPAPSPCS